jgi:putative multiple sugar transport system ATP-binding protein
VQKFARIRDSEDAGIAIIYQELALVPEMRVYENIFLGNEIRNRFTVNWNETIKRASEALKKVKLDVNPDTRVKDLGVGKQQLVEIAKALSRNIKLLILDEPTSALNENDSENLLELLRDLKNHGVTCIMISHKLKEVIAIADRVTVLRDGQTVVTLDAHKGEVSENVLIKHMVGREIDNIYPAREHKRSDEVVLEVKGWNAYDPKLGRTILRDINFNVKKGEIVGFAGLMGSGRTELALSLFGNAKRYRVNGEMVVHGKKAQYAHPQNAIQDGVAYSTEDRKAAGLILIQDVKHNITLANLRGISERGVVNENTEIQVAEKYRTALNIKTPSIEQKVGNLSGGNQQKVCLGKWLFVNPNVLILDEPTRGIDVGAKYEIYSIMNKLVEEGMSIIMISSELPEVLGMSDRVYIVSAGRITGELPIEEATQEKIMALATN